MLSESFRVAHSHSLTFIDTVKMRGNGFIPARWGCMLNCVRLFHKDVLMEHLMAGEGFRDGAPTAILGRFLERHCIVEFAKCFAFSTMMVAHYKFAKYFAFLY